RLAPQFLLTQRSELEPAALGLLTEQLYLEHALTDFLLDLILRTLAHGNPALPTNIERPRVHPEAVRSTRTPRVFQHLKCRMPLCGPIVHVLVVAYCQTSRRPSRVLRG